MTSRIFELPEDAERVVEIVNAIPIENEPEFFDVTGTLTASLALREDDQVSLAGFWISSFGDSGAKISIPQNTLQTDSGEEINKLIERKLPGFISFFNVEEGEHARKLITSFLSKGYGGRLSFSYAPPTNKGAVYAYCSVKLKPDEELRQIEIRGIAPHFGPLLAKCDELGLSELIPANP